MSLRAVLQWPDARLQQVCAPVDQITSEIRTLASDMLETMNAAPGRGLAAPQVGVLLRLFVMDVTWKEGTPAPMIFVNPVVSEASDTHAEGDEVCLSIPGVTSTVPRPDRVRLRWSDLDGVAHDRWFDGPAARCAQHELDHLNGVVTLDHLPPADRTRVLANYAPHPA